MELFSASEAASTGLSKRFRPDGFFNLEDLPEPTPVPQQLQDLRSYLTFQSGYLRAQMRQFAPDSLVEDEDKKRNDLVCDWATQFAIRMREFLFSENELVPANALSPNFLDLRHRIVVFMETLDPSVDLHRDPVDKSFMDRMRPFLESLSTYLGDHAFWESQRSACVITQESVVAPEVIVLPDSIPRDPHVSLTPFHAPLLRLMALLVTGLKRVKTPRSPSGPFYRSINSPRQRNPFNVFRNASPPQSSSRTHFFQEHRPPDHRGWYH